MALLADKIVTLKLGSPLFVASGSSMRQVIETIQQAQAGSVLIVEGERSTWARLEQIRNCSKIGRTLDDILDHHGDHNVKRFYKKRS